MTDQATTGTTRSGGEEGRDGERGGSGAGAGRGAWGGTGTGGPGKGSGEGPEPQSDDDGVYSWRGKPP
ncbi:MAG: hypothetical protein FWD59_03645 [Micrococcales bacterium]|nr:hypothetical protein [Micrococcales bacterium]